MHAVSNSDSCLSGPHSQNNIYGEDHNDLEIQHAYREANLLYLQSPRLSPMSIDLLFLSASSLPEQFEPIRQMRIYIY